MKVIVVIVDGKIDQVEKYKDDGRTIEEYESLLTGISKGGLPYSYEVYLCDVAVFDY